MRILITTERQGAGGGIETYLRAVSPCLVAAGHEVGWLFGMPAAMTEPCLNGAHEKAWQLSSVSAGNLPEGIEAWEPDIVYAHGLHDPNWDAALARRYPTAYFMHGYSGACISGRKCHSGPQLEVCTRTLGPACLALYLPLGCGGKNPLRMISMYLVERNRQLNLRRFPAVLAASRYMAQECSRQGVSSERTHHLPLFPTDQLPDQQAPEPRALTNRILLVARLTDVKGTGYAVGAVAAASRLLGRELTLAVAGDGPGGQIIVEQARREKVAVELLGRLNADRRNQQMRNADVLLVPSVWPEPFGLVGIEAGCVGLPAAAFNVGGISDWLVPGVSGEMVPGDRSTADDLGQAIARAVRSETHWQTLRIGAWQTAKKFDVASHVIRLLEILQQTASKKGSAGAD